MWCDFKKKKRKRKQSVWKESSPRHGWDCVYNGCIHQPWPVLMQGLSLACSDEPGNSFSGMHTEQTFVLYGSLLMGRAADSGVSGQFAHQKILFWNLRPLSRTSNTKQVCRNANQTQNGNAGDPRLGKKDWVCEGWGTHMVILPAFYDKASNSWGNILFLFCFLK